MKKKITFVLVTAITVLLYSACKKSEPLANDRLTASQLASAKISSSSPSPSTSPTPSSSPTPSVSSLMLWTSSTVLSQAGGLINVYVDGTFRGSISGGYSASPACGSTGAVTTTLSTGSHSWYAESGNNMYTWGTPASPVPVNISSACTKRELTLN